MWCSTPWSFCSFFCRSELRLKNASVQPASLQNLLFLIAAKKLRSTNRCTQRKWVNLWSECLGQMKRGSAVWERRRSLPDFMQKHVTAQLSNSPVSYLCWQNDAVHPHLYAVQGRIQKDKSTLWWYYKKITRAETLITLLKMLYCQYVYMPHTVIYSHNHFLCACTYCFIALRTTNIISRLFCSTYTMTQWGAGVLLGSKSTAEQ